MKIKRQTKIENGEVVDILEFNREGKVLYEKCKSMVGGYVEHRYEYNNTGFKEFITYSFNNYKVYREVKDGIEIHYIDHNKEERRNLKGQLIYRKEKLGTFDNFSIETWYNDNGKVIKEKNQYNEIYYEYDDRGNNIYYKKLQKESILGIRIDEIWFRYNENNKLIHKLHKYGFVENLNRSSRETWYEYDKNGNKISEKNNIGEEKLWKYDDNGVLIYTKLNNTEYWYDKLGNVIKYIDNENIVEHEYDGYRILSTTTNGDKKIFKYDDNNHRIYEESEYQYEFYDNKE